MGTIASKRIRARLRAYLAYAGTDERPVLWVVPDQRRLDALNEWARHEAAAVAADPTIFWLTTQEHISQGRILGPIWQIVGGPNVALRLGTVLRKIVRTVQIKHSFKEGSQAEQFDYSNNRRGLLFSLRSNN